MKLGIQQLSITLVACMVLTMFAPLGHVLHAENDAISVNVNWTKGLTEATSLNYGLNAFNTFDPTVAGNADYNEKMTYMNPGLVRFHSWEMLRDSGASDGKNGWLDVDNQTWDAAKIAEALSGFEANQPQILMNIPGWPSWMDLDSDGYLDEDQFDDFAQFCADLVEIINVDHQFGVVYWEPTNERDDLYYTHLVNDGKPHRMNELIEIYNQAAKAMKAVDPTIKTGGPAFARPDLTPQVQAFVDGTINEQSPTTLDFLTYHFYASGDLGESDTKIYDRPHHPTDGSVNTLATTTSAIRSILDTASPDRHIPLWLDEYNISWSWTNNDPRMHNEKGAVFDALAMIYAQKNGAQGTTAWNDYDGIYGKITGSDFALQPNAHTFQLMNNYFVGQTVEGISEDEAKVVAYAVKNNGKHSLMLVNRTNDVQLVNAELSGIMADGTTIQKHQLSSAGYSIQQSNWYTISQQVQAVPPNSVTVFTDSSLEPAIAPDPLLTELEDTGGSEEPETEEPSNLSGKVADSTSTNLTSDGTLDWRIWGSDETDVTSSVYKAGGDQQITDITLIGTNPPTVTDVANNATWSDGDPVASATNVSSALNMAGEGNGFEFTVPAGLEERTLKVNVGVLGAKGVLTASLSDGSAPDYSSSYEDSSSEVINNSSGAASKVVTLRYKANSPDQTLTVRYVMNYNHWGNSIWLQGASLSAPKSAMLRGSVGDSSGGDYTKEGNVDWAVWGTNSDNLSQVVSKKDVPAQISEVTILGETANARAYVSDWWSTSEATWSDGDIVASGDKSKVALVTEGTNNGFTFTVPADETAKTLKIYLGVMGAKGILKASLSDGSAPDFITSYEDGHPNVINNSGGASSKVVSLTYQAGSPDQVLTIEYTMNYDHWGNVLWLQGAALSGADIVVPTPPTTVAPMATGASYAAIQWSGASDNAGITEYKVYKGTKLVAITNGSTKTAYIHGLSPNTDYSFTIVAKDAAGNVSASSAPLLVTTNASDQITYPGNSGDGSEVIIDKPVNSERLELSAADLSEGGNKPLAITLPAGKTTLSIPLQYTNSLLQQGLEVHAEGAVIKLNHKLMEQAAAKLNQSSLSDAKLLLKVTTKKTDAQALALDSANAGNARLASLLYDLELTVETGDGVNHSISSFDEPVEVSFSYDEKQADEALLGVYLLNEENNKWGYIPGDVMPSENKVIVHLPHFSTYSVMEYKKVFSDVPAAHWAYRALEVLAAKHIVEGQSALLYHPNDATTRAEWSAFLVRSLGLELIEGETPFTDVPKNAWYSSVLFTAYEAGLVNGKSENTFQPDAFVTREEAAVMLDRALQASGVMNASNNNPAGFQDDELIAPWATEAVNRMKQQDIVQGAGNGMFLPKKELTRAESAAMLYRAIKLQSGTL